MIETCLTRNQGSVQRNIVVLVSHFIETFRNSCYTGDDSDKTTDTSNDFHTFAGEGAGTYERSESGREGGREDDRGSSMINGAPG